MPNKPLFGPGGPGGGMSPKPEAKKMGSQSSIFGSKRFSDKSSLRKKLEGRQDFYTDSNIKMGKDQRTRFSEKLKGLLPGNKSTFNPEDFKRVDKKLAKEESLERGTSKEFEIKRERAALKKLSGLK